MLDVNGPKRDIVLDQTEALAGIVWTALQERRVPPTPRNYELFFTYYSGLNLNLTRQLEPHLRTGMLLTPELLEAVYEVCIAREGSAEALCEDVDAITQAAQLLVKQVTDNQQALHGYSNTLAHWTNHLGGRTTIEGLLQAVTTLSAETSKASDRNRTLERKLSASTARIAKLRGDLIEVRQQTTTDGLTGITNRKAFEVKLRRAIAHAKLEPSSRLSLLLLDVDHFKRFNDTHGHRTGDHVLRLVARLLSDNVKGRDTVARYGGEEFTILLADADVQAGITVARGICERLEAQRLIKKGTGEAVGQITISIGVAQYRPLETGTELLERADQALYEAKRTGRNRVCAAPELDSVAV